MLKTFDEVCALIGQGNWLHIAGTEALLKKLPRGKWIGGSTEYFMSDKGGVVTGEQLFVDEFPFIGCKVADYDENTIENVTKDAFDNGFSVVILPFDSSVHIAYSKGAASFEGMFLKNIVGWVAGLNLSAEGQTPVAVNGLTGQSYPDRAVVLHIPLPEDKLVNIGIINIFEPKEGSPVITFEDEGFSVKTCRIDGREVVLADYLAEHNINTNLPLIGDYSGAGVNVSIKQIADGVVNLYAPVFQGIRYHFAAEISDYAGEFKTRLEQFNGHRYTFSCNCILNFLYGGLEGKTIDTFFGPITFGEVAYQLVNQTLVYVEIL